MDVYSIYSWKTSTIVVIDDDKNGDLPMKPGKFPVRKPL